MEVRSLYVEPEREAAPLHWPALECHDVFKIYRSGPVETVALRGLDLRIERGEIVAVLGPSGCGKSTFLALAAGLDEPSAGEVRVFGRSLGRLDEAELAAYRARELAVIFQSDNLWPALSAQENVAVGLRIARREDPEGAAAAALDAFGLAARRGNRAAALSGGEQQRWPSPPRPRVGRRSSWPTSRRASSTRATSASCSTHSRPCAPTTAAPSPWSRTPSGWPPAPTASSSCATGGLITSVDFADAIDCRRLLRFRCW